MSNPAIQEIVDAANESQDVMASAVTALEGVAGRIEAAVAAALANGATAEELAPVSAEAAELRASAAALGQAIANTSGV